MFLLYWSLNNGVVFLTVKIIMDKISKRSKGYAFVEYTTEEAASAALKEMNGKVGVKQVLVVSLNFSFNCHINHILVYYVKKLKFLDEIVL